MPKICYESKRFNASSKRVIHDANVIIEEYRAQGFALTLRQLYYQFVARGLLENTQQNYKRLGSIVNDARLAGVIDWLCIEDRTRNLQQNNHWRNPEQIIDICVKQFRIDLWATQPRRVEVWIEKEALVGVIESVCRENDVPFFACRGYVSQSEQWRSGIRFSQRGKQRTVVLHFGDHDPSGLDMTRDNHERLSQFAEHEVEVRRLALNMDQVEEYSPPPNPAKVTDSRFDGYVERFGHESWELDALEPRVIVQLIQEEIDSIRDPEIWVDAFTRQEEMREQLRSVSSNWIDIIEQYA